MVEGKTTISPQLIPFKFEISSATFMPSNTSTGSEVSLKFTFALKNTQGQFLQINFDEQGFVPIYSELLPLEVTVNDKAAKIVDLEVKQTGFYWASIEKLTLVLPMSQNQQSYTVLVSGM